MPSPAAQSDSVQTQQDVSSNSAAPNEQNGWIEGQMPNAMGPSDELPAPQPRIQIQEGKQKAKAVMAASGLSLDDSTSSDTRSGQDAENKAKDTVVNGAVPSRKRSRSGTRISHPSKDARPSSEELRDLRSPKTIEKMVYRQWFAEGTQDSALNWHSDLVLAKNAERDSYLKLREQGHPNGRLIDPTSVYGKGYDDRFGNGPPPNVPNRGIVIVYPGQRKRAGGRHTRELRIPKKELAIQSEQFDELVPVRLDIEWDKVRLRDTFTWNLHDRVVPPELFAQQLVEDFQLPLENCQPLVQLVAASIHDQIQDFYPPIFIEEEPLDPHLPYNAYKDDEMRIVIKLNITIGQHTLVDQFEWEINNPMNSPEQFAEQMTTDLSLSGEFTTAIAHSIREQSQLFIRSLYVTGHPFDGRPVEDQELKAGFQPSPLPSPFRPYQAAKEFAPYIYMLSEQELEKTELSLSREERRQKRSVNRRGGPAMPDLKDRRRTIRTMVVSTVLPYAAEAIEDSRLFKRAPPASGRGRRPGYGNIEDLDDSDESASDESAPNSPAIPPHLLSGTARTRHVRGAATVAQQAMRGTLGRSATPESTLHHHETRTSGRRRDYREESDDDAPPKLMIKLKLGRERFRQFMRDQKARSKPEALRNLTPTPGAHRRSQSGTPGHGTSAHGSMAPPSTTPGLQSTRSPRPGNSSAPGRDGQHPPPTVNQIHPHAAQIGRVDAKGPPSLEHPIVSSLYPLAFLSLYAADTL